MSESTATHSVLPSHHRLEIALGHEKTVDVFFFFDNDNRCSTRIASHKNILSSKSDVFQAMFSDKSKQSDDIVIIDATAEHFSKFLQTFYDYDEDITKNISIENVREILYLARKYNAAHCLAACHIVLSSVLNSKMTGALYVMELALLYDIKELIKECAFDIAADCYEILDTVDFYQCSQNVLKCFLENIIEDDFYSNSYYRVPCDICIACMVWAEIRCKEQNMDPKMGKNLRSQLNDFFGSIPFNYMKRSEFHVFLSYFADVFTVDEIKSLCGRI